MMYVLSVMKNWSIWLEIVNGFIILTFKQKCGPRDGLGIRGTRFRVSGTRVLIAVKGRCALLFCFYCFHPAQSAFIFLHRAAVFSIHYEGLGGITGVTAPAGTLLILKHSSVHLEITCNIAIVTSLNLVSVDFVSLVTVFVV